MWTPWHSSSYPTATLTFVTPNPTPDNSLRQPLSRPCSGNRSGTVLCVPCQFTLINFSHIISSINVFYPSSPLVLNLLRRGPDYVLLNVPKKTLDLCFPDSSPLDGMSSIAKTPPYDVWTSLWLVFLDSLLYGTTLVSRGVSSPRVIIQEHQVVELRTPLHLFSCLTQTSRLTPSHLHPSFESSDTVTRPTDPLVSTINTITFSTSHVYVRSL